MFGILARATAVLASIISANSWYCQSERVTYAINIDSDITRESTANYFINQLDQAMLQKNSITIIHQY